MNNGIYDMPMPQYLSLPAFSGSLAQRLISESPYHAWVNSPYNPDCKPDYSKAADIGSYAHAMLLEGGLKALCIINADDWRTKAAKEERDNARFSGLLPILVGKVEEVERMVEAAKKYISQSELAGILDKGKPEQTLIMKCDNILLKCRPDWLTTDGEICLSYKTTTGSANPEKWIRAQLPQYTVGMALYEHVVESLLGSVNRVVHLVQEQSAPYACSLIALSNEARNLSQRKLEHALNVWERCIKTQTFDAYPTKICYAETPAYELMQWEEFEGNTYDVATMFKKEAANDPL